MPDILQAVKCGGSIISWGVDVSGTTSTVVVKYVTSGSTITVWVYRQSDDDYGKVTDIHTDSGVTLAPQYVTQNTDPGGTQITRINYI